MPPAPQGPTLTPAALLWEPPMPRSTLAALEPPGPRLAVALPTLGVALGALGGWSTRTRTATPTALEAEVSFLWAQAAVMALPSLHPGLLPALRPRPRQPYLTAVTARAHHTRLAQAVPAVGVAGLHPARGAVTPCRQWAVARAQTPSLFPPDSSSLCRCHPAPSGAPSLTSHHHPCCVLAWTHSCLPLVPPCPPPCSPRSERGLVRAPQGPLTQ